MRFKLFVLCTALALTQAAAATDRIFNGYARHLDTGALLYVESHAVRGYGTQDEQRVVRYRCAAGQATFARKQLDYAGDRTEPLFQLEDGRTGYLEGLRRTQTGLEVFQRSGKDAVLKRRAVPQSAAIVSDAGFDEFVRLHWTDLEANRTVKFRFLVPSRLDSMSFKVHKHGEAEIEGAAVSVIRLNLSGFLGWFLPYIEVSYRKSDRVLMRYKGLTNIRDVSGRNMTVQIDFPSAERVTRTVDMVALGAGTLIATCPAG